MLDECGDSGIVGNLGASLYTLKKARLRVVDGFIIPVNQEIVFGLSNEILRAYDKLGARSAVLRASYVDPLVFDSETIRDVKRDDLISTISYVQQNAGRRGDPAAVVVQKNLRAEFSGTIHSYNPVTHDQNEILIEANIWMNDTVLSGETDADMILINKSTGAVAVESNEDSEICLTPEQIERLHNLIRKVEKQFNHPVSVDWCFDQGILFILHARPINKTTHERYEI